MRQLGATKPVPANPVDLDFFLTTTGKGEDVWWSTHRTTRACYESWSRYAIDIVVINLVAKPDFRGSHEYLGWWARACKSRFLSQEGLFEDPRVLALPAEICPTPSQSRPDIPFLPNSPADTLRSRQVHRIVQVIPW
ncbi:hypothetical protein PIB30_061451 [Stylosanthes scabra]|uniref:Uncharacterized protein n=1 Tax=Stylosanthes scabra TaxID=79078 RepID=A0ABU6SKW4_9FABA|nr:hypothetical protein [Stylosanthes scabra]